MVVAGWPRRWSAEDRPPWTVPPADSASAISADDQPEAARSRMLARTSVPGLSASSLPFPRHARRGGPFSACRTAPVVYWMPAIRVSCPRRRSRTASPAGFRTVRQGPRLRTASPERPRATCVGRDVQFGPWRHGAGAGQVQQRDETRAQRAAAGLGTSDREKRYDHVAADPRSDSSRSVKSAIRRARERPVV